MTLEQPTTERHSLLAGVSGEGIEIGAFHSPLPVGDRATVTYVDMFPATVARRYFSEIPKEIPIVDPGVICAADRLEPFATGSLDFVLASHLLEHLRDPIGALVEWHRVLRDGGLLYLCVPDKRHTFDEPRERTPLEHLVLDHAQPAHHPERVARDLAHYREWARVVNELVEPAQADFWARLLARIDYPIHFHCWIPEDLPEIVAHLARYERTRFAIEAGDERAGSFEFALLLRKAPSG